MDISRNPADIINEICESLGLQFPVSQYQKLRDYCEQTVEISNAPTAND